MLANPLPRVDFLLFFTLYLNQALYDILSDINNREKVHNFYGKAIR